MPCFPDSHIALLSALLLEIANCLETPTTVVGSVVGLLLFVESKVLGVYELP